MTETTEASRLVASLTAALEAEERVALAACGRDGEPGQPEHWHWECTEDDTPVDIDLAIAGGEEYLEHGEHFRVGLRSVQQYPTRSVGPLSHLVLSDEEVRPQDARHIARHDPARTLRQVAAHREILNRYAETLRDYARSLERARGGPIGNADLDDFEAELPVLRSIVEIIAGIYEEPGQ